MKNCKRDRSLFDLFSIYNCYNCKYNKFDYSKRIGELNINIYHIYNNCIFDEIDLFTLSTSKKLKLFLKDAIICNNILVLWLDDFDLIKNENILFCLLEFNLDIHIIID